jgi:integrase
MSKKNGAGGIRTKTRFIGVYTRGSKRRLCPDGTPDLCFEVTWQSIVDRKMKYEIVGWKSEGVEVQQAVERRVMRVQEDRHFKRKLMPSEIEDPNEFTLEQAWEVYKQKWLPNLKSTESMISAYNSHLKKAFGDMKLSRITPYKIEEFKQSLFMKEKRKTGQKIQSGSVRIIMANLRRILYKCKEWGLLKGSVPIMHLPNADNKRERFLSISEAEKFLDGLIYISCDYYFIAKFSLYTGMRLGEVLSITKQNINLDAKILYTNGKGKRRTIYIPDSLTKDIEFLYKRSKEYIFFDKKGNGLHPKIISVIFGKIINDMGFNNGITDSKNKFVFHTLRHTFCSWLAMQGVPLLTIGELVGHATLEMTHRYAKLSPDNKREASNYIGKVFNS